MRPIRPGAVACAACAFALVAGAASVRPGDARAGDGAKIRRVHVAAGTVAMTTADNGLWVSGFGRVTRLDLNSGRVLAVVHTPGTGELSHIAHGAHSLWVTAPASGVVYRIDPRTDRVSATIHVGGSVAGIAVGAGRAWVTRSLSAAGQLLAIDVRSDRVSGSPIWVAPGPGQLVYGLHAVWVQNTSPASVMRVDPGGRRAVTVIGTRSVAPGSLGAGAIAVGDGALWATVGGSLLQVDPTSGHLRTSASIPRGVAVAPGQSRIWVLSYPRSSSPTVFEPIRGTAALWQVDPSTGRVLGRPTSVEGSQPIALTVSGSAAWIADYAQSAVRRLSLTAARVSAVPGRREPSAGRTAHTGRCAAGAPWDR